MLKNKIIEIGAGRVAPLHRPAFELDFLLQPLDIPVLPETLLRMELCLGGPTVGLREISQVVLGDLGAAMHVFRLAGCQQQAGSVPFNRVEDCLSYLGIRECIDGLSKRLAYRSGRRNAVIEAWAHAHTIASFCSLWAEMNDERINPSEAYFVGLFHDLGALPGLLQWDTSTWEQVDAPSIGQWFTTRCALPSCVTEYFSSMHAEGAPSGWVKVVDAAHQMANQYVVDERPRLKGAVSYR